nr:hypothetical protein [uncultured Flavobacterium sp.]
MTKTTQTITKIHFYILGFIFLNLVVKFSFHLGLNNNILLASKIILYLSGTILFIYNIKPFKTIALYFSFFIATPIILLFFWLFGGLFFGLLSSLLLFPIYPIETQYQKNNITIYSKFQGFLGSCCTYQVTEKRSFIFEKYIGEVKLEEVNNLNNSEVKIKNNYFIYNHKTNHYDYQKNIEIKKDTIETIIIK